MNKLLRAPRMKFPDDVAERFIYARILLGPLGDSGCVSTADEYRRYAAECMALAERLTDPSDKSRLVQMAQAFLDLAERRDRLDPPSG
jgi:hypothetical protein